LALGPGERAPGPFVQAANSMSKEYEYRKYAASLLELAMRAASKVDKTRLLLMSDAWLHLADKISVLAPRRQPAEWLIREVVGEDKRETE